MDTENEWAEISTLNAPISLEKEQTKASTHDEKDAIIRCRFKIFIMVNDV